jgi:hypothetical protein
MCVQLGRTALMLAGRECKSILEEETATGAMHTAWQQEYVLLLYHKLLWLPPSKLTAHRPLSCAIAPTQHTAHITQHTYHTAHSTQHTSE